MNHPEVAIGKLEASERNAFKIGPFGSSLKKAELVAEGIPVLGIENVLANWFKPPFKKHITKDKYRQLHQYSVRQGDVLVTTMGTIGRAAVVPHIGEPMIIDSHLFRMRLNLELADPSYLCFALNGYLGLQQQLEQRSRGAIMAGLNTTILKECTIPLPSLPEQQRIAGILSRADRLRRLRRYALEMSESYLQGVFLEMFGDPATNPMGWEMHRLGKHIKFLTSGPRGWADYYSDSGVRFIRSLDVQMNRISEENPIYVRPPVNAEASRTRVRPDDVLLTITGSRIGRVAPVSDTIGEAYVSQHVAIIRMDATLRPDFVSMFLSHPRGGQEQIARFQYGQTKPGLNLEQIRAFEIQLPPQREQERYSQASVQYDRLRVQQREALRQAEHLFQTLLYGAFRGEV